MKHIISKIQQRIAQLPDGTDFFEYLSGSELNSLLLQVFNRKASKISCAELLRNFNKNRFARPVSVDPIALKSLELFCLQVAKQYEFEPLILSPLAPLGSCSAVAEVNQNNVVSALRGTEVVSDATNVLALKIAEEVKNNPNKKRSINYAAVHRHTRAQAFENPNFSAHFSIFCLASGGINSGNDCFEVTQLRKHISIHYQLLSQYFESEQLFAKVFLKEEDPFIMKRLQAELEQTSLNFPIEFADQSVSGDYYHQLQFKIFFKAKDALVDLADGGVVDWTQKLLSNRKHRLFISGTGIELLLKLASKATTN